MMQRTRAARFATVRVSACLFGHRRSRHLAACNILASGVVFARPGCCGVVQGVVSGFLTGRCLLPFSSSKMAGSHNLSIYPCVLTCVGSNPPESSGDSHLTLPPKGQAKTARCAAIVRPGAASARNSALYAERQTLLQPRRAARASRHPDGRAALHRRRALAHKFKPEPGREPATLAATE